MQAVGAIGQFVSVEEFGEDGLRSMSTATVRLGPPPELHRFTTAADERAWVFEQLDPDDEDLDATAILLDSNHACDEWVAAIGEAGIGAVRLADYHGRPTPGVKVGTLHRAKGLEFKTVYIPALGAGFGMTSRLNADELIGKGSLLYAAMSRARDRLILSHHGEPSDFLESAVRHLDVVDHRTLEDDGGMAEPDPLQLALEKMLGPGAAFRDGQREAIEAVVRGERSLVVQRTGWGKSLVYLLATRMLRDRGRGPTLVISPLLSLMRNQLACRGHPRSARSHHQLREHRRVGGSEKRPCRRAARCAARLARAARQPRLRHGDPAVDPRRDRPLRRRRGPLHLRLGSRLPARLPPDPPDHRRAPAAHPAARDHRDGQRPRRR